MIQSKILSAEQAAVLSEKEKQNGKTVVFTNGCFDILHSGHVTYLEQAKALGDILILGLNSDKSVKSIKGPERPINNETDRAIVIAALESIDYVVIFEEDTPIELLKKIKPNIQAKGGDYVAEELPEFPIVTGFGGTINILPFVAGKSTTSTLEKIQQKAN
jgi:glycerol-3-phosphate cytidylyltransferase